ncbi:hypothetical protein PIB30_020101 [Stylosanthes scabra]|uniref:Uncharacterized protein n=1 Tax=Stylosanthes scabra TaxID=79078 RepID=A0ABU6W6H4_9FABA|nr:hypothetical protein [Stylosanthes scabra]
MVDCFQWEPVQEWMFMTCEGTVFDVFVKEVGGEMLIQQVHPDVDENDEDKAVRENHIIDVHTSRILGDEADSGVMGRKENRDERDGVEVEQNGPENVVVIGVGNGPHGCAAQLENETIDDRDLDIGLDEGEISDTMKPSCPFPHGFGPCRNGFHIHGSTTLEQQQHEGVSEVEVDPSPSDNPKATTEAELEVCQNSIVPDTVEEITEEEATRCICEKGANSSKAVAKIYC